MLALSHLRFLLPYAQECFKGFFDIRGASRESSLGYEYAVEDAANGDIYACGFTQSSPQLFEFNTTFFDSRPILAKYDKALNIKYFKAYEHPSYNPNTMYAAVFGECKLSRKNVLALYAQSSFSSKTPTIAVISKSTGMPINAFEIAVGYFTSFTASRTTIEVISDS